ncbi:MAG: TIGR02186 family protein [Nitrospirae bacterium]|nr:TIGR02186 family protein [Nitrospirota bacterium]
MTEDRKKTTAIRAMVLVMLVCASFLLFVNGTALAALTIKANHDHIKIDFFYHGSTVSMRGVSDPGTDLIIKIASPDGHQALRQKGKVAGLLWMNVGELRFEQVPLLYSLHSTRKISDILSPEEMDKYAIGLESVGKKAEIQPVSSEAEKTKWYGEFVKFKESSNLYAETSGDISLNTNGGEQNYYVLSQWPYQAPPGDYIVTIYAVKDKKVVEMAETKVFVEQVGVVKSFAEMAKNSAALYGTISIVAALAAGFGVGLIFRKGGGAH